MPHAFAARLRAVGWSMAACSILAAGCASFEPKPLEQASFHQRTVSGTDGRVTVTVAALTESEARDALGVNLASSGIQPVWVGIENRESISYLIPPLVIDGEYFSPLEAAWQAHGWFSSDLNAQIDAHLLALQLPKHVGPGATVSGFVFTHLDRGNKYVNIELIGVGTEQVRRFGLLASVPDLDADYLHSDPARPYGKEGFQDLDEAAFRDWVERLPCCVAGGDRKTPGDPLNVVFVAERMALLPALARRGWRAAEAVTAESVWETVESSVFDSRYRYGPVSPLYLFDRHQDFAVQKARASINQRIHMRLWLAPVKVNGTPVWVGQISRDIGVRLTSKTITTHKIDAQVDDTRAYLIQDMYFSHGLARFAYATGVGPAAQQNPRFNYTGDPYWTDGLRLVMWLSVEPVAYTKVQFMPWEKGPER